MNQNDSWIELLVRSPILQAFIGAGVLIGILMLVNDVRKRLFVDSVKNKSDNSITQELRLIHQEYRELVRAQRAYIEDLQEEATDHKLEIQKLKTNPIPPLSDIENYERKNPPTE